MCDNRYLLLLSIECLCDPCEESVLDIGIIEGLSPIIWEGKEVFAWYKVPIFCVVMNNSTPIINGNF